MDSSGRVHEFADSQIGHIFAFGTTRNKARKAMILALKEMSIRGEIRTTVEYLVKLMESHDFRANNIDTTWLDARIAQDKIDRKVGLFVFQFFLFFYPAPCTHTLDRRLSKYSRRLKASTLKTKQTTPLVAQNRQWKNAVKALHYIQL